MRCLLWIIVGLWLSAPVAADTFTQRNAIQLAAELKVSYQVLDNRSQQACNTRINNGQCFSAQLRYQTGSTAIPAQAVFYFSHISPIVETDNAAVSIARVNGDLHTLRFNKGLAPHQTVTVTLKAPFWHAARTDVMPNHYMVYPALEPVIIDSTKRVTDAQTGLQYSAHAGDWAQPAQYLRAPQDTMPRATAQHIYTQLPDTWPETASPRVIPQVSRTETTGGDIKLTSLAISDTDSKRLGAAVSLLGAYGLSMDKRGTPLRLITDTTLASDAYTLAITDSAITLTGADNTAFHYALLSLMQLYNVDTHSLPAVQISDAPRYGFRGVHIDIARHFPGKGFIHTLLRQMYRLKLNRLHLHLSDDEGWRLAIPGLPELTEVGAYRCHDLTETRCLLPQLGSGPHRNATGNGYLSVAEYQAILTEAAQLGIEVIPSIDVPGHARAAITAMEARYQRLKETDPKAAREYRLIDPDDTSEYSSVQFYNDNAINPCVPGVVSFMEKVLDALIAMHRSVGVPLTTFHFGADEIAGAWTASPACKRAGLKAHDVLPHFVSTVVKLGEQRDLTMAGWSDGIEESLSALTPGSVQANVWKTLYYNATGTLNHLAENNMPAVLSLPDVLYFDFPYQSHPLEPGYYWGSKATDSAKVFSFMPEQLARHDAFWPDRMGNAYTSDNKLVADNTVTGIQAQLWTEVTPDAKAAEYMLFPRLYAFAERAWHRANWQDEALSNKQLTVLREKDWTDFAYSLGVLNLPRLAAQGFNVRIPPPGAVYDGGALKMRAPLPGLEGQFRVPGSNWQSYRGPVEVTGCVQVRTRLPGTEAVSRILPVNCRVEQDNKSQ